MTVSWECRQKRRIRQEAGEGHGGFPFCPLTRMMPAMNVRAVFETVSSVFPDLEDMDRHFHRFAAYTESFYTGEANHDFHLDLKAEHSRNVFSHACALARAERVFIADSTLARASLLAARYHDVGRFPQHHRFGTFRDPVSVNHARLSAHEVKRTGFLDQEKSRVRRLALAGIVMHNRFSLPLEMNDDALAVVRAVRDADKLDIMRIMAEYLTAPGVVDSVIALNTVDSPEAAPAILEAVMAGRLGSYADTVTTTDFKLLVCGWLYDLNYAWSRRAAAAQGHLAALAASLPETEQLRPFVGRFSEDLTAYASS